MKTKQQKSLMTRKQAAEYLSVSLTTLRTWTETNIVPGYRLGGRIYYKEKDILSALQEISIKPNERFE